MRAELTGTQLRVLVDGAEVWLGAVPDGVLDIDGPAGVRSDNGAFDFDLRVPGGAGESAVCAPH